MSFLLILYLEAPVKAEAAISPPTPSSLTQGEVPPTPGTEVANPCPQWVCVDAACTLHSSPMPDPRSWRESGQVRDCQLPPTLPGWLWAWAEALHVAAWLAQTIPVALRF